MTRQSYTISIKEDWCKACGICIALCPQHYLAPNHVGVPVIDNENSCIGCKACVLHCPDFCLEIKEV